MHGCGLCRIKNCHVALLTALLTDGWLDMFLSFLDEQSSFSSPHQLFVFSFLCWIFQFIALARQPYK